MKYITLCLLLLTVFPLNAQSPHEILVIDYLENESDAAAVLMPNTVQVVQDSTIYGGEHFIKITFTTTSMGHPNFLLPALEDHTAYFLVNQPATEIIFGFCLHYPAFDWDYLRQRHVETEEIDVLGYLHPLLPTEITPIRIGVVGINHSSTPYTIVYPAFPVTKFLIDGEWKLLGVILPIIYELYFPPQQMILVEGSVTLTRAELALRSGEHALEAGISDPGNYNLFFKSDTFGFEVLPADTLYFYPFWINNEWKFHTVPSGFPSETITDTLTINNRLYYHIPSYFHEGEAFFRGDSLQVYRYYQGNEVLWYDFSIDTGQTYWNNHYQVTLLSKDDTVGLDYYLEYVDCYHFYFDDPAGNNDFEEWISPYIGPVQRFAHFENKKYYLIKAQLHWITGIEPGRQPTPPPLITTPELFQNYPNPFNAATTIRYRLPRQSRVTLEIYNVLGQKIAVLVDAVQQASEHPVSWDGRDRSGKTVASGIYLYRLTIRGMFDGESYSIAKKLILMK